MLSTIAIAASVPLGMALVVGALVSLAGLFFAPDMAAMASFTGRGFWSLAVLMPLALWGGLFLTYDEEEHTDFYGSMSRSMMTTLQAALLGGGLGAGPFYLLSGTFLPVILRGYDVTMWAAELRSQILWMPWLTVVAITVLAALPLSDWAHRAGEDYR